VKNLHTTGWPSSLLLVFSPSSDRHGHWQRPPQVLCHMQKIRCTK
jgi:hypothetical protein